MQTLRASALSKARRGETTFEEAMRVTHSDDHGGAHACPVCDRKVEEGMVVCPHCMATLDRGHCRNCSRPLDPDWRICPWCRTPAPAPDATSPAEQPSGNHEQQPSEDHEGQPSGHHEEHPAEHHEWSEIGDIVDGGGESG